MCALQRRERIRGLWSGLSPCDPASGESHSWLSSVGQDKRERAAFIPATPVTCVRCTVPSYHIPVADRSMLLRDGPNCRGPNRRAHFAELQAEACRAGVSERDVNIAIDEQELEDLIERAIGQDLARVESELGIYSEVSEEEPEIPEGTVVNGWARWRDPESHDFYYVNAATGESAWDVPVAWQAQAFLTATITLTDSLTQRLAQQLSNSFHLTTTLPKEQRLPRHSDPTSNPRDPSSGPGHQADDPLWTRLG